MGPEGGAGRRGGPRQQPPRPHAPRRSSLSLGSPPQPHLHQAPFLFCAPPHVSAPQGRRRGPGQRKEALAQAPSPRGPRPLLSRVARQSLGPFPPRPGPPPRPSGPATRLPPSRVWPGDPAPSQIPGLPQRRSRHPSPCPGPSHLRRTEEWRPRGQGPVTRHAGPDEGSRSSPGLGNKGASRSSLTAPAEGAPPGTGRVCFPRREGLRKPAPACWVP